MNDAPAQPTDRRRGLRFEDFSLGQVLESGGRTLTEADLVAFAGLSGDYNPLHCDEEFAAGTGFRGRIAHGLLIQAVSSGLAAQMGIFDGTIQALADMIIHFRRPAFPGDTIRLRLVVSGVDESPSNKRGRIRFETTVFNQHDEVVVDGEWETVMFRRGARVSRPRKTSEGKESHR